jgi:hypothetical protein
MSTAVVDRLSLSPGTAYAGEDQEVTLASAIEELVRLRFCIILTARWEAGENEDADRRTELRSELADLRALYFDQVDEIAMTFGVQQAMDAKEEVERNVIVPRLAELPDGEEGFCI